MSERVGDVGVAEPQDADRSVAQSGHEFRPTSVGGLKAVFIKPDIADLAKLVPGGPVPAHPDGDPARYDVGDRRGDDRAADFDMTLAGVVVGDGANHLDDVYRAREPHALSVQHRELLPGSARAHVNGEDAASRRGP
ncbi:hypothetical protein ABZT47_30675 [Sphaerisporangium sp. NPDC005289]|uniref:hypothetical protein n=1 Tax=Sphaerisporangium sp. NPDC005289 TaxID=3155247 RepID=UPI0033BE8324